MSGIVHELDGLASPEALADLEVFTRHNGVNTDDIDGWRRFIVRTFRSGQRVPRDDLFAHLARTRRSDSAAVTARWVDEYEEAWHILEMNRDWRG